MLAWTSLLKLMGLTSQRSLSQWLHHVMKTRFSATWLTMPDRNKSKSFTIELLQSQELWEKFIIAAFCLLSVPVMQGFSLLQQEQHYLASSKQQQTEPSASMHGGCWTGVKKLKLHHCRSPRTACWWCVVLRIWKKVKTPPRSCLSISLTKFFTILDLEAHTM